MRSVRVICKKTFLERHSKLRPQDIPSALYTRILKTHESQMRTVDEVLRVLRELKVSADVEIGLMHGEISEDLVISIGGDGTLLLASHRIGAGPRLLGINGAPGSSVGFFCAGHRANAKRVLRLALEQSRALPVVDLTRMQVALDGTLLTSRALNEVLFCHRSPAATTRYALTYEPRGKRSATEEQRSSGLWVGPAAGSTAAQRSAGGRVLPLTSTKLQFVVREPYMRELLRLPKGLIAEGEALTIESRIATGSLFIDGHETEHAIPLGGVLRLERSPESLCVLGLSRTLR
jgi:NAD+ kinase